MSITIAFGIDGQKIRKSRPLLQSVFEANLYYRRLSNKQKQTSQAVQVLKCLTHKFENLTPMPNTHEES